MKPDWTVTTTDGITLGATITPATGPVRARVLLLHAMMVDARTLDRPSGKGLASTLAARGFEVHRADLRGRGMSERPADWSYDDLVYRDVPALLDHFEEPPWVMTHSLGGHVTTASWASGCIEPRGLVGLASSPWVRFAETSRRRVLKKSVGVGLLRTAARAFGRMPARRFRMGSVDESAGYTADLARFWRTGWRDRHGHDWLDRMSRLRGQILYIASDRDTLFGHPDATAAWARTCPTAEFLRVRDGDFGLERAPDHMELGASDLSRPIWEHAADWMLQG